MKKALFIILGIIIILGGLFAGWYFFLRTSDSPIAQTINNVLPFGNGGGDVTGSTNGNDISPDETTVTSTSTTPGSIVHLPMLFQVSDEPVAGAVGITVGTTTIIRYADRATGHISEMNTKTGARVQITNNTLPKVYAAVWSPTGNTAVFRTLSTGSDIVTNTLVRLTPPVGTSTLYRVDTTMLRGTTGSIINRGDSLAYVSLDAKGIQTSALDGTKIATLLSTPFTDWHLFNTSPNIVALSKPGKGIDGFAYSVSAGSMKKILGPLPSLTLLPNNNASRIAYSFTSENSVFFRAADLSGGYTIDIFPATLADKCVWSVKNKSTLYCGAPEAGLQVNEPDNWYQGISHYSDRVWRFDTDTNYSDILVEPKKTADVSIDVYKPFLTPAEDYLVFINKDDLTLWALKLSTE